MKPLSLTDRAVKGFTKWGGITPAAVSVCPGRVNLIGEHTDYQLGLALPIAIDRYVVAVGALTHRDHCLAYSSELGESGAFGAGLPEATWVRSVYGMRQLLDVQANFDIYIESNLPIGSGLSSSAALNLAVSSLICHLVGRDIDKFSLALSAQRCENEFGGTPCGLLDQIACTFSQEGHATLIDFETPDRPRLLQFPNDVAIAITDSGIRHSNASSGYAERRRETEEAAHLLGVANLRQAGFPSIDFLPEPLRRRARHVITENGRVAEFTRALDQKDFAELGQIMNAGHESLMKDFEVSCPEVDALASLCQKASGVYGARMTGGGFGGSCVALLSASKAGEFVNDMSTRGYAAMIVTPSGGCFCDSI